MFGYGGFLAIIVIIGLLVGFREVSGPRGGMGLPLIGAGLLVALYVMFGGPPGSDPAPIAAPPPPDGWYVLTEAQIVAGSMGLAFALGLLGQVHRIFDTIAGLIGGALIGFSVSAQLVAGAQPVFVFLWAILWLGPDLLGPENCLAMAAFFGMMISSIFMMAVYAIIPWTAGWLSGRLVRLTLGRG